MAFETILAALCNNVFPYALCAILIWYIQKRDHDFVGALNANTSAIQLLTSVIGGAKNE